MRKRPNTIQTCPDTIRTRTDTVRTNAALAPEAGHKNFNLWHITKVSSAGRTRQSPASTIPPQSPWPPSRKRPCNDAETRNGTRKRLCNDARPFFSFRNALCNDAGPISGFGTHPASTQSRFPALRHPFAMMRAEIRKKPLPAAALRAIKTGLRRYNGQKHAPVRGENARMKQQIERNNIEHYGKNID